MADLKSYDRCFNCFGCGGHFRAGNPTEERDNEFEKNFGHKPTGDEDEIKLCDDCYEMAYVEAVKRGIIK